MPTYRTASEEETIALGERLAGELPRRGVVLLIGNLGAGKTTLAKGIVRGRGAAEHDDVSSPTFTLIHEYGADSASITSISTAWKKRGRWPRLGWRNSSTATRWS